MSCCGKQRAQYQTGRPRERTQATAPQLVRQSVVYFEYLGRTGMTVQGPVSGQSYRFDRYGARVAVDLRDRPALAAVPHLRQVQSLL